MKSTKLSYHGNLVLNSVSQYIHVKTSFDRFMNLIIKTSMQVTIIKRFNLVWVFSPEVVSLTVKWLTDFVFLLLH